jgi:isocitrate dehydrogenase
MEKAFEAGEATNDLARFMANGRPLGTKEFGECVIKKIEVL